MIPPTNERATAPASPAATAEALASGPAAVRWWQTTALLEVHGHDALTFLDGLCTQAVTRLDAGAARLGLFLDAKAKIIAPAVLWRVADTAEGAPRLLLEVPCDCAESLRSHLRKYRLRAKVEIELSELALIVVAGPEAAGLGNSVLSAEDLSAQLELDGLVQVAIATDAERAGGLLDHLVEAGAVLADPDAWEALRIERGSAGLHDLLPGRMPAEVGGMEHAVALDAGCYLGQEPVARLHYRGHANRTLRRVRAATDVTPAPPTDDTPEALDAAFELRDPSSESSRASGRLTTWARHPDGHVAALAVVRREVPAGTVLELPGDGGTFSVSDQPPAT